MKGDTEMPADAMSQLGRMAVLGMAWNLRLPSLLAAGPRTTGELAGLLGVASGPLGLLLEALAGAGLVDREGEHWCLTTALPPAVLDLAVDVWSALPGFVADGRGVAAWAGGHPERARIYARVAPYLAEQTASSAAVLAERLGPAPSVLDLGCGAGPWSLAMARRWPGTRVVGCDLAEVVPAFQAAAVAAGVEVEAVVGDVFEVALPQVARVVVGNLLHLLSADEAAALVARAAGQLGPGGELVIVDAFSDGRPASDEALALYRLQLAMRVPGARPWAAEQVAAWLRGSGLHLDDGVVGLPRRPLGAVVARRVHDAR